MAWRIDEQVIRGEIDNRTPGKVLGQLWLVGRDEPIRLELEGNPWRDLAGHLLRFTHPAPKAGPPEGLAAEQRGVVGDITASRKVKVPDISMDELMECYRNKEPFPWHWGNSLYLEWFSLRNGRVVIETTDFVLELDDTAAWSMSEEEELEQRRANGEAMTGFMDRMLMAANDAEDDDDEPQSKAEAEADADAGRMDTLLDRVQARIEREGHEDFETIMEEERERMKRERGEVDPVPTPEQEAERQRWIEEMNAICEQAVSEAEADKWKGEEPRRHPLVERCGDLAVRLHHDVRDGRWIAEDAPHEHPLREIINGTRSASAKLAGALGTVDDDEWPPEALFAGNVLVRLKKARGYLRDALAGLDSADREELATPGWRAFARRELGEILAGVETLIGEVREVLADDE